MKQQLNLKGKPLEVCSLQPKTGYLRDGFCRSINHDYGVHTVCAKMNPKFLEYTKSQGNDLSSVVSSGQNWCLCQDRWEQAYQAGKSPEVLVESTNLVTKPIIQNHIYKSSKRTKHKKKKSLKKSKKRKKFN